MEKIKNLAFFLKEVLWRSEQDEERNKVNYELSEKISFRCTKEEKELMIKYCELRNIELSEYLRVLNHNHITQFIIDSEIENEYYDSLEKKKKLKKSA